jgi:hypothetical protein
MVDEKTSETKEEAQSETLFSKVVDKTNKAGNAVGRYTIEVKTFDGFKFVQITQEKFAFGSTPAKRSWVTFDPDNKDLKDALSEAFKK